MRALAIETSSRVGSVALADAERLVAEDTFPHGLKHAAGILPLIDRLCRAQGWKPSDVQVVYVSAGPGSFTGLRIGITLAKILTLATGAKLVAVPTVRVLAENAPTEARHLAIVLDAKRDQIYTAAFERPGTIWQQRQAAHLSDLAATLAQSSRPIHLLGDGIPFHRKFIPANDPGIIITPEELWRPRAEVVARIGHDMATAGQFTPPDLLTPLYIRRPEAEEKWDQRKAPI